ncbi:MAG: hypothetical protein R2844_09135 [Caldilineales bacterium]
MQVGQYLISSAIFTDIAVQGQYAYVTTSDRFLRILDLANPQQPVQVGSVAIPAYGGSLVVSGRYAYIGFTNNTSGLRVVDVTNPAEPRVVTILQDTTEISALEIQGQQLYAAGDTRLQIYDLSANSAVPQVIGMADLGYLGSAYGLAVAGTTIVVPHGRDGLYVMKTPVATNSVELPLILRSW